MKRISVILFFLFLTITSYSQKQTAFWYFGELAGLDFNSGNPVALSDSQMETIEGCATISDYNGNLLFYTNGITIWNKNHEIMLNGTGLNGDLSSTNSAIIIPKPGNINTYYIFTVDNSGGPNGLQYSIVNMSLDGGNGGVTTSKNIALHTPTTEKITAVKHQNDTDWWVLTHKWNSNEFIAYLVTNGGISSSISSFIGTNVTGTISNTVGAMKFSPNGEKVAIAHSSELNHSQLFNFDDITGVITNPITFTGFNGSTGVYGVEFSVDSKLLYLTDEDSIYQYNTELSTPTEIINSRIVIASSINKLGAIQIAPNGKIYVARENNFYLGVISNPNVIGMGSNYIDDGVYLNSKKSKFGLPPFIQSFFWKEIVTEFTCFGDATQFTLNNPEVSQIWNFDDPASGSNNTSTAINPIHAFTALGTYSVSVISTDFLGQETTTFINVTISETPIATTPTDYALCDDDTDDDATNGIIQSFELSTKDAEILGTLNTNQYDVQYFEDSNLTLTIPKNKLYENTVVNTQSVFAKVYNLADATCFDMVSFNLIVNPIPQFDLVEEKIICSNDLPDYITVENPQGTYNYEWALEDGTVISTSDSVIFNTIDLIPDEGATITVTATDLTSNCTFALNVFVKKFEIAALTQEDIIVDDLSNNNTITIAPQDPGFNIDDYEYALDDSLGGIGPYQDEPFFERVIPGIRTIYIRDKNGCDTFDIEVSVVGFQNFFTPNNDGYNDYWQILGVNENFYTSSIIKIYNRFGKVIANVSPQSDGWDGYYNGQTLPASDYWFTVQLIDNAGNIREHKGHFSLIRR